MKASAGDVFCVYSRALGQYTACQITKVKEKEKQGLLLLLDWRGDEPLKPEELSSLRPLRLDYLFWRGDYELTHVPLEVPGDHILVGNVPPLTDEDSRSWGGWGVGGLIARQLWWETIPPEKRVAFKAAAGSREPVSIGSWTGKKGWSRVFDTIVPIQSASDLRALPCATELCCTRWYPDLPDYLREDPFLVDLRLENHGQKTLDLRGTSVSRLTIDLTGMEELWLGERTGSLLLLNREPDCCVIHAPEDGGLLEICSKGTVTRRPELPALSALHCHEVKELDLAEIRQWYPRLRELRLWGKPGYLRNFGELKNFPEMRSFSTVDLFGFTGEDIPKPEELPNLIWLWMSSLPEDAARAVKKLYGKREGLDLRIQKPRKPEWMAENLDNPFRHWDGMEGVPDSAARRAAKLYKKLRSDLWKLAGELSEDSMEKAREAVVAYTKPFNRMDFVETEEREEIYAALCKALDELPEKALDREKLIDAFEDTRDF